MNSYRPPHARAQAGFSLVELLVAMVIGLIMILAVASVLLVSEGRRRSATFVNDIGQTGNYAAYWFDLMGRSAGGGYAQVREAFGCRLNVSRNSGAILPRGTVFPAPFANIPGSTVRLAPLVIYSGLSQGGSDVISFMGGAVTTRAMPAPVQPASITSSQLALTSTIGFSGNDLVMVVDRSSGVCLMEQVTSGFVGGAATTLPLGGTYYTAAGTDKQLTDYNALSNVYLASLGNGVTNLPYFQMVGVGQNNTLYSYDLLQGNGSDTPLAVMDGVKVLKAVYGLDTNGDGVLDVWKDAGTAPFDSATLLNGSAASSTYLQQIVAVRVGMILQSNYPEKDVISPASFTLFKDLGTTLQYTRSLSADEQHYRYRLVEETIPLRNTLIPGIL